MLNNKYLIINILFNASALQAHVRISHGKTHTPQLLSAKKKRARKPPENGDATAKRGVRNYLTR